MVTPGGIHKEMVVGNPADEKNAKFVVVIPKSTYVLMESLSEEKANFHTYVSVPGKSIACSISWQQNACTIVQCTPVCRLCGRYLAILDRPIRVTVPAVTVAPTALVGSLIRSSNLPHSLQRGEHGYWVCSCIIILFILFCMVLLYWIELYCCIFVLPTLY